MEQTSRTSRKVSEESRESSKDLWLLLAGLELLDGLRRAGSLAVGGPVGHRQIRLGCSGNAAGSFWGLWGGYVYFRGDFLVSVEAVASGSSSGGVEVVEVRSDSDTRLASEKDQGVLVAGTQSMGSEA